MPRYKRSAVEAELDVPTEPEVAPEDVETLTKLRNMWEFASLMQYIFLFGHVVKIDEDLDIEDLEAECLKRTPSEKLAQIGLALLKYVSSHRGLTPEIFDEYTRRQYMAKAPARNPFGDDEEPLKFNDMDVFTRIEVLQQLSMWTFGNVERIRGMMPQDDDHLSWRMEPLGWDKEDRSYFVLDDNRLYRRSDEPLPPPTPPPKAKSKSKSSKKSRSKPTRASKRRKVEEMSDEEPEEVADDAEAGAQDETVMTNGVHPAEEEEPGYGFSSKTWSCVAITLEEYQDFLASIFRSRDPNEKQLRKRVEEEVLPIIEKRNEALRQKQLKKLRELENLQKMATAKRSSRLADKAEKDREEREKREAEEKKERDLKMAHEEEERQRRIEEGHESRRLTREQRIKEREVRRILHEEELQKLQEAEDRATSQQPSTDEDVDGSKRISVRQTQTQKEQHKKELQQLKEEAEYGNWYFDCAVCGVNGENLDDGTHSLACDRCNVWQHSKCHGFTPKQAEKEGFVFICKSCKRKEEDAKKPKIPALKLGKSRPSASPEASKGSATGTSASRPLTADPSRDPGLPAHVQRQLDGVYIPTTGPRPSPGPFGQIMGGQNLPPQSQPSGYRYPPVGNFAPNQPQHAWSTPLPPAQQRPPSAGYAVSPPPQHMANGYGQRQTSPHQVQHQYAHQHAVASAGGHPAYHQPYPQQNGYSPRAQQGQYTHTQPYQNPAYPQPSNAYNQNQQRPGSAQLMNGFQSPAKNAVTPVPAPSPPQQGSVYGQPARPQQQQSPSLQQSPRTTFPPPQNSYAQYNHGQSPVKSSPPAQPPVYYHQAAIQPSPQFSQQITPQQVRPPSQNGFPNGVVADGMAGPWPAGSKAIPQKHDQTPAPPAASNLGAKPALTPSPGGQPAGIPVKKDIPEGSVVPAVEVRSNGP